MRQKQIGSLCQRALLIALLALSSGRSVIAADEVGNLSLLSKSRSALAWTECCKTSTNVRYWSCTDGASKLFAGFQGHIVSYRSPDDRLHLKIEGQNIGRDGSFSGLSVREEFIGTDKQLLTFVCTDSPHPGPRDGHIRIYRTPDARSNLRKFATCGPQFAGFLDGNFGDDEGIGRSVLDFAEEGKLDPRIARGDVNGIDCRVIVSETRLGKLRLWIAPDEGCNIAKFELNGSVNDPEMKPHAFVISFTATQFKLIKNQVVVVAGKFESISYEDEIRKVWKSTATASRSDIQIDPPFNDPTVFTYSDVPEGLKVEFDDLGPSIVYTWRNGRPVPTIDVDVLKEIATGVAGAATEPTAAPTIWPTKAVTELPSATFLVERLAAFLGVLFAIGVVVRHWGRNAPR